MASNEPQFHDIFLSHNSVEKPEVRKLATELQSRNFSVWMDEQDLPAGLAWIPQLETGLRKSAVVAVCLGRSGIGPWQQPEIEVALLESVRRQVPVVPLFLPSAPSTASFPEFLKRFTWLDLRGKTLEDCIPALSRTIQIGRALSGRGETVAQNPVRKTSVTSKSGTSLDWSFILQAFAPVLAVVLLILALPFPFASGIWKNYAIAAPICLAALCLGYAGSHFLAKWHLSRLTTTLIWLALAISIAGYFLVYLTFTEVLPPESGVRTWTGTYTKEFREVLKVNNMDHALTKAFFLFDTERIYTRWSSNVVLVVLAGSWFLAMLSGGAAAGLVARQKTSELSRHATALVVLQLKNPLRRKLQRRGIETLGDLIALSERQLGDMAQLDQANIETIRASLNAIGLSLRGDF